LSIQKEHGQWAEDYANEFLLAKGYEVITRNWRYRRAEIDIIARDKGILVFIEVKCRDSTGFGKPEETVNKSKRRLIIDAAQAYMRSVGYEWEIRFDIIALTGKPGHLRSIHHFEDAFFPGLNYKG
jgi:putative endonuclease